MMWGNVGNFRMSFANQMTKSLTICLVLSLLFACNEQGQIGDVIITVDKYNICYIGDTQLRCSDVASTVASRYAIPDVKIILRTGRGGSYKDVLNVLTDLRKVGVKHLAFVSSGQPISKEPE